MRGCEVLTIELEIAILRIILSIKSRDISMKSAFILMIGVALLAISTLARADAAPHLRYADRKWSTLTLAIPANQAESIHVTNDSKETIEFDSFKLNREKTVSPGET